MEVTLEVASELGTDQEHGSASVGEANLKTAQKQKLAPRSPGDSSGKSIPESEAMGSSELGAVGSEPLHKCKPIVVVGLDGPIGKRSNRVAKSAFPGLDPEGVRDAVVGMALAEMFRDDDLRQPGTERAQVHAHDCHKPTSAMTPSVFGADLSASDRASNAPFDPTATAATAAPEAPTPAAGKSAKSSQDLPRFEATPTQLAGMSTEQQIGWRTYWKTRGVAERNVLIEMYSGWVQDQTERLARGLPSSVDALDLAQEATFRLVEAIERFEPGRNARFETFARMYIHGAAMDFIRTNDWAPRLVRQRSRMWGKVDGAFFRESGRAPTDVERQEMLGVDDEEFERIRLDANTVQTYSMNAPKSGAESDDGEMDIASTVPDRRAAGPDHAAARRDLRHWILRSLTRRERLAVVLYHGERLKMKEVGQALGLSESRVSQILKSVHARVAARFGLRVVHEATQAG